MTFDQSPPLKRLFFEIYRKSDGQSLIESIAEPSADNIRALIELAVEEALSDPAKTLPILRMGDKNERWAPASAEVSPETYERLHSVLHPTLFITGALNSLLGEHDLFQGSSSRAGFNRHLSRHNVQHVPAAIFITGNGLNEDLRQACLLHFIGAHSLTSPLSERGRDYFNLLSLLDSNPNTLRRKDKQGRNEALKLIKGILTKDPTCYDEKTRQEPLGAGQKQTIIRYNPPTR